MAYVPIAPVGEAAAEARTSGEVVRRVVENLVGFGKAAVRTVVEVATFQGYTPDSAPALASEHFKNSKVEQTND